MTRPYQRLLKLLEMQGNEFKRDFGAMFFSFAFPLFFVVVLVASSLMTPKFEFVFGVVDEAGNPSARRLAEALATDYLTVRTLERAQASAELKEGEVQAVLILPAEDLAEGGEMELIVGERFQGFARMALDSARSRLLSDAAATSGRYPFRMTQPQQQMSSDFAFMYPGMLALALLQLGLFATATPLLRARERGTLRHLLLTPLLVRELLASQVGFRFAIAMAQVALLLGAGMFVVDLGIGQWLAALGVSCLGAIMLISIGYTLAGLAPNLEGGMAIIMIANFAMLFAGNIFSDPKSVTGLYIAAHFLPVSYLADAYRQVINQTAGLWPIWLDLAALLGWSALALLVAVRTFHFDMETQDRPGRGRRQRPAAV